jgi:glyoxylase-like metal-dependent hydrolase (beta-lactamase superfamily II)
MGGAVAATVAVGDARVTALLDSEGPFFAPLRAAFPGVTEETLATAARLDPGSVRETDTWWLSFWTYVVEVAGRVVLVDTGAASDTAARSTWAPLLGTHFTERFTAATGLSPDDVTHVVLTHLHGDHTAGSVDGSGRPAFANAVYLVPADDLSAIESGGGPLRNAVVEPLRRDGQLRACSGDLEIVAAGGDGPAVRVIPTPGHTPGHQSVVVESGDESALLAGDVVLHAAQLVDPGSRYAHDDDHRLAVASRRELLARWRRTNARLGTAHLGLPWILPSALSDEGDADDG